MSLEQYPLTVGPNLAQLELMTLLGEEIDPGEFTTPAYSEAFEVKYGNPIAWPRAWQRLMAVSINKKLLPHYSGKFLFIAENISFLDYCKSSDLKASQQGQPVLGRQELEGAWVQELIYKYDEITKQDLQELVGRPHIETEADAMSLVQQRLKSAVAKRFTSVGIEEYWAEKPAAFGVPDLDIAYISDKAAEPAEELAAPVYDDDEVIMDVEEEEEEEKLEQQPAFEMSLAFRPLRR